MEYDPEYLAAIEREQQRLIWDAIARARKAQADHARVLRKRAVDYTPHRRKADSRTPRTTYAAHKARHELRQKFA